MSTRKALGKPSKKTLIHTQTEHGELWIQQEGDRLQLKFDHQAVQTEIDREQPHHLVMTNLRYLMGVLLFIPPPKKILVLGVGGGAIIHFFQHYHPGAEITGVDYDAELIALAHEYLGLPLPGGHFSLVIEDARTFIANSTTEFDLIVVDIFEGSQSPNWMLQPAFLQALKKRLTPSAAIAFNLLIESERRFSQFYQSLGQLFTKRTLYLENDDYENRLVFAINGEIEKRSMEQYLQQCQALSEQYDVPFAKILAAMYNLNPLDSGIL